MDFDLLEEIAADVGTPFYLFDPRPARQAISRLQSELEEWGPAEIAYSVKTNPLMALLEEVRAAGAWAEVVSSAELELALSAGFAANQIVFNGPLKAAGVGPEVLALAGVNIDGLEEIEVLGQVAREHGQRLDVGIRVCTPLSSPTWSRFGLSVEAGEFGQAVHRIEEHPYLRLKGLHVHLGTQVPDERTYRSAVKLLRSLWADAGVPDDGWLDLGGGFPFDHAGENGHHTPVAPGLFRRLAEAWEGPRPRLWIEPGRVIAGPAMSLICRVISRKIRPREPDIYVIDGGTNLNVMGAFFEHRWHYRTQPARKSSSFRICGPLCMEDDIMSGVNEGAGPEVGQLAVMGNAGAYSLSLSRSFIQHRAPVIAVVNSNYVIQAPALQLSSLHLPATVAKGL